MAMHVALVRDKLLLCGATEIWGCLFLQQSLALPDWHTLSHLQGTHPLRAKGWVNTAPYPCLVGRPWEGSVMASWNGPGEAELPSCRCGVCSMPGHWQGLQLAEGSLPSLLGLSGHTWGPSCAHPSGTRNFHESPSCCWQVGGTSVPHRSRCFCQCQLRG